MMDALTDDIICQLATFCTPNDLVNLGRTCQRFGARPGGFINKQKRQSSTRKRKKTTSPMDKAAAQKQRDERAKAEEMAGRKWSLIDEAARKMVYAVKETDEEWRKSWISVYDRLESQWKGNHLKFSRFIGNGIGYIKGDLSHVGPKRALKGFICESLAVCQEVMKTGRHYAEFTITVSDKWGWFSGTRRPNIALLRPIHDDAGMHTKTQVEWVPYNGWQSPKVPIPQGYEGYCRDNSERPGFEGGEHSCFVLITGDEYDSDGMVLGLLLDLDEGTLTKYINGRKWGVIKRGLMGHYCWTVYPNDCTVKIHQEPIPVHA